MTLLWICIEIPYDNSRAEEDEKLNSLASNYSLCLDEYMEFRDGCLALFCNAAHDRATDDNHWQACYSEGAHV